MSDQAAYDVESILLRLKELVEAGRSMPMSASVLVNREEFLELLEESIATLPQELRDRFDIVGWDPRGTGASTGVDCGDRLDYLFAPDASPETVAAQQSARRIFTANSLGRIDRSGGFGNARFRVVVLSLSPQDL